MRVWTDGACKGNPGPGGWAFWTGTRGRVGAEPHTTNNRMELTAIREALFALPATTPLTVVSDSEWAIRVITGKYHAKENLDLIEDIKGFLTVRPSPVTFEWTRGHDKNIGNVTADMLATEVARYIARRNM